MYSTKEFCELCNVGRETLRHYEKLGFLHPHQNPDNHYRSYDAWDGSIIADIKRYQSLGFSLKEIKAILSEHSLPDLITLVEGMGSVYQNKIKYYEMLYRRSLEELQSLRLISDLHGKIIQVDIPSFLYLSENELLQSTPDSTKTSAMQHLDYFIPCLRLDRTYQGDEAVNNYSGWGLAAKKEYTDYLNFRHGTLIHSTKAFATVVDAGEKGNITKQLFAPFIESIPKKFPPDELIIYAALLTRTHDVSGHYHRFFFTFAI